MRATLFKNEAMFRKLWMAGQSAADIAEQLGVNPCLPQKWATKLGLLDVRPERLLAHTLDLDALRVLWGEGRTIEEIGLRMGISKSSARRLGQELGLPPQPFGRGGRRYAANKGQGPGPKCHHLQKIDLDILPGLWADNVPAQDIAERFGVQCPAVYLAVRRLGLPPRANVRRRAVPDKSNTPETCHTAEVPEQRGLPTDLAVAVLLTEGRWQKLSEVAARLGITIAKAQQLWHSVRT